MQMAAILATVLFMSVATAPMAMAGDDIIGAKVAVPIGQTLGVVFDLPLKGAVASVLRAVGAIGSTTGQIGDVTKTLPGLERYVGAKIMIDPDGKGIVSEPSKN